MADRFILLNEKIMEWEWFDDVYMFKLFICMILMANYKDTSYKGIQVKRGSFITSIDKLQNKTGLSHNTVEKKLKQLISTGEITEEIKPNKYRIITIVNYDKYQAVPHKKGNSVGSKKGNKVGNSVGTYNKYKKDISDPKGSDISEEDKKTASPAAEGGGSHEVSVAEIKKFAAAVPGGDDYIACDFRRAFIRSKTKFPDDWKEIFTRFAAADKTSQSEFLDKLQSGAYRDKWGSEDT